MLRGALPGVGFTQVAVAGDDPEPILHAVRELGAQRLILIHREAGEATIEEIVGAVGPMGIETEVREIGPDPLLGFIETIETLARTEDPDDVVVNLAAADKDDACAALSAAYVAGVKAIDRPGEEIVFLPILRFSYGDLVSEAKMDLLAALEELGGEVTRLRDLADEVGIQDSLASYHVRGGDDGEGLVELGLVDVERGRRGALTIRLTSMGTLIARGLGDAS